MKVLFIGMTKNIGGTETFIMNIARILWKNSNFDTYFLNIEDDRIAYNDEIIKNGGHIINYSIHKGISGVLYNNKEADDFFCLNHFDTVHVNANILRNSFWANSAKKMGVNKVFFHSHNSSYGSRNFIKKLVYSFLGFFDRYYLRKWSIPLYAASSDAGHWMFHENKFEVIHNGVDTNVYKFNEQSRIKLRKLFHIEDETFVVISVARFSYQKNHHKILTVFASVLESKPDSKLILVGEGELFNYILEEARTLGIDKKVLFLGRRTDIPELLSMADTMLFPSRYEGTPFSLIEAESSGLPVVVSKEAFDSTSNITKDIKYLSINDTDQCWSAALIDLFENNTPDKRTERNKLVEKSNYSLNHFRSKIKTIYDF